MSSDVTQTTGQGPSFSGMGRATLAIAARIGGLFAAVVVVAIVFLIINPNFANPNLGVSVLRDDELGRDHGDRADAGHCRRRD